MTQILLFYLQGIPEMTGVVACGLALARVKLRWGVILAFACVLATIIYIIRSLPVTFGLHSVAAILLTALLIARFTQVPLSTSFIASFASFVLLALLEVSVYELVGRLLNIESSYLAFTPYTRMLMGLPQAIILIVIAPVIARYRKPLEGMWKI